MTTKELIDFVNQGAFFSLYDAEEAIREKHKDVRILATGLDVEDQRWYSTATTVYLCADGCVGVNGCDRIYAECATYEDINIATTAKEYEAVFIKSYKPKQAE